MDCKKLEGKLEKKRSPLLWIFLGMGIMLVLFLVVGGIFLFLRNQEKDGDGGAKKGNTAQTEEKEKKPSKTQLDDETLVLGTACKMSQDAALLLNELYFEMTGLSSEMHGSTMENSAIAVYDLMPVKAYYCEDMGQAVTDFMREMDLSDEIDGLVSGGYVDLICSNFPTLLAGKMVSVNYLASMATMARSCTLHLPTKRNGICSVVLQYSNGEGDSYEDCLYSWTIFQPSGDGRMETRTYQTTPIFNMEWGQEILKDWKVIDEKQVETAVKAMSEYDYNASSDGKEMKPEDYRKIAETAAAIFKDYDFAEITRLYSNNQDIANLVSGVQTDFHNAEPVYEVYSANESESFLSRELEGLFARMEEELREADKEELTELFGPEYGDKPERFVSIVKEQSRLLMLDQGLIQIVAEYGSNAVAFNSVMKSAAAMACKDVMGGFPKPKGWDGPKVVVMKYDKAAVAVFFQDAGHNYVGVGMTFLTNREGFDEALGRFGFGK